MTNVPSREFLLRDYRNPLDRVRTHTGLKKEHHSTGRGTLCSDINKIYNMLRALPRNPISKTRGIVDVEIKKANAKMATSLIQPFFRRSDRLKNLPVTINLHYDPTPRDAHIASAKAEYPANIFAAIINENDLQCTFLTLLRSDKSPSNRMSSHQASVLRYTHQHVQSHSSK